MSPAPGQLSHDEFAELVNLRNELARRYPQVDAEALNAELMSLALYGRLSGDELRATAKRFIELKFGIGRYPARELGGVLINETARVPVDGPVHHRSPPRRVQVVPATAIIPK